MQSFARHLAVSFLLLQIKRMTRQWSRGEKWLFIVCGIFCLPLLVGSWIYERQNELPPPPPQITKIPPTNNALDGVVQAVGLLPPMPPSSVLVKGNYKSTGFDEGLSGLRPDTPISYTAQYNRLYPLAKKLPYLKSSQAALALWRQSLSLPLYVPPGNDARKELSQAQLDGWGKRHQLVNAAYIQARACWQRGDNANAMKWLLGIHRSCCQQTTFFYNDQVHPSDYYALSDSSRNRMDVVMEIGRLMPHLDAYQLKYAATELEKNCNLLPSLSEALNLTLETEMAQRYRWCARNDLRVVSDEEHPERVKVNSVPQLTFRWTNKKRILNQLRIRSKWLLAQARTPAKHRVSYYPDDATIEQNDVFFYMNFSVAASYFTDIEKAKAQELVLLTSMAVRAFERERGHPPRTLRELAPKYLQKIDHDPFNSSAQLHYSPYPKTYTLWHRDKWSYSKPIPSGFIAIPPNFFPVVAGGPPNATGYHTTPQAQRLPFLLYSVGPDGHDNGGMDFKGVSTRPISMYMSRVKAFDDVLAPPEWFTVTPTSNNSLPDGISAP